jgi:hypothetical protein
MNERKFIYVALALFTSLGSLVPGMEVLAPLIGPDKVKILQWVVGGAIAAIGGMLTAWRAYIDQHESRREDAAQPEEKKA